MTVTTMLWETRTAPIGDAEADGYSSTMTRDFFQGFLAQNEGVFRGYGDELFVTNLDANGDTMPDNQLRVLTGAAVADGIFVISDSIVTLTLPTVGSSTGFIVTMTIFDMDSNTGFEARSGISYTMNTTGVTAIPAPTQTRGSRWDIVLAQGVLTAGGSITTSESKTYFTGSPVSMSGLDDRRRLIGNAPHYQLVKLHTLNTLNITSQSFDLPQNYDELYIYMRIRVPSSKTIRARFNNDNWNTYTNLRWTYEANAVARSWAQLQSSVEMYGAFPSISTQTPLYTQLMHLPNYMSGNTKIGFLRYAPSYTLGAISQSSFTWNRPDSISKITLSTTNNTVANWSGDIAIFGMKHGDMNSPLNSPIGYWS